MGFYFASMAWKFVIIKKSASSFPPTILRFCSQRDGEKGWEGREKCQHSRPNKTQNMANRRGVLFGYMMQQGLCRIKGQTRFTLPSKTVKIQKGDDTVMGIRVPCDPKRKKKPICTDWCETDRDDTNGGNVVIQIQRWGVRNLHD